VYHSLVTKYVRSDNLPQLDQSVKEEMTALRVHNVKTVCYAFERLALDSRQELPYESGDDSVFVVRVTAFPPVCTIRKKPVGLGIAQAVRQWLLIAEVRVKSHSDPCGICGEQSNADAGLSPCTSVSPSPLSLHHATSSPLGSKAGTTGESVAEAPRDSISPHSRI
jgi:hypothetical protein